MDFQRGDSLSFFCKYCGTRLDDGSRFCKKCGAALVSPSAQAQEPSSLQSGSLPSNVMRCADGKLRWTYELKLFKNPVLFILCTKIFLCILAGIWIFINIICLDDSNYWPDRFLSIGKVFLIAIPCVMLLVGISYLIYAAIMGGSYCAVFEMDENGINHIQMPKQYKKAQVIGLITTLVGALSGNMSAAGAGLLSMGRQSMYSEFASTRRIKAIRRQNTIKVNGALMHNQIYVPPGDFDFVLNYMTSRCPRAKY